MKRYESTRGESWMLRRRPIVRLPRRRSTGPGSVAPAAPDGAAKAYGLKEPRRAMASGRASFLFHWTVQASLVCFAEPVATAPAAQRTCIRKPAQLPRHQ